MVERVVQKTLHEKPAAGSIRKMARVVGLSYTSVQRIWKVHEFKPQLVKIFKLSNDKRLVEKVRDIVGLYLDPPDKALVFSVDEKTQIQALDRTQPGLPIKKGRACTITHSHFRVLAQPGSASSALSPATASAAASSEASPNSKPPSSNTSSITMPIQSPSSGRSPLPRSSVRSLEGNMR
jgi:hypothetical protein